MHFVHDCYSKLSGIEQVDGCATGLPSELIHFQESKLFSNVCVCGRSFGEFAGYLQEYMHSEDQR